eukprot:TRINITY_DN1497_c0_g1_i1.p2 TRINITY_DN1497_c0_g1~~TRINITY_DN1497_c0_g1_i1.p2  ORF type:complete len:101 (-),score=23.35 TRINITY_DN1497_c0_g1_i1:77-379(-)
MAEIEDPPDDQGLEVDQGQETERQDLAAGTEEAEGTIDLQKSQDLEIDPGRRRIEPEVEKEKEKEKGKEKKVALKVREVGEKGLLLLINPRALKFLKMKR